MNQILIIDDDAASCRTLQLHFQRQGHKVNVAHNLDDGLAAAHAILPEVIILDIRMPGRSGLECLPEFKQEFPETPVIMITAFHDMDTTVLAMKRGADDYIDKPVDIDELDSAIAKALARAQPRDNQVSVGSTAPSAPDSNTMVGRSRAIKEVFKVIGRVAPKPATVLVTGESGTGKELVARAIHKASSNPSGPFIAVNCAALVETLLESDLFGHEKGAFTGAVGRQMGKFALANDGTIFLDEISELSQSIQAKLLRVLQEKEFIPVGGTRVHVTNARVVTATNVDLATLVEQGTFREDLYYRLQVVTIAVPPLRDRMEDIEDLVPVLLARINREMNRNVSNVAGEAMDALRAYSWPGNVRELENVLMKAVALCLGMVITRDALPANIAGSSQPDPRPSKATTTMSLDEVQKEHVLRILTANDWHRGRACSILGVSRPRLRRLIKQHGLTPPGDTPEQLGDSPNGGDGKE
jgi:DNA-binding NtrC family response regulator